MVQLPLQALLERPGLAPYVPARHRVQDEEPDREYVPRPHARQAALVLAPGLGLYVPAGQLKHVAWLTAPVAPLYVPGEHREQNVARAAAYVPGLQVTGKPDAVLQNPPAMQLTQAALLLDPVMLLNVPAGQGVATLPRHQYPTGHSWQEMERMRWLPRSLTNTEPVAFTATLAGARNSGVIP